MNTNGKITVCNLFKSWEFGYLTVKLLSVTCLKVKNLFLNGKIERWNGNFCLGNYRISFGSYSKSKILKLPIPSNEQSLDSNLLQNWKKSVYSSNNSISVYYQFVPLNRYQSTPTAHPWLKAKSRVFNEQQIIFWKSRKSIIHVSISSYSIYLFGDLSSL